MKTDLLQIALLEDLECISLICVRTCSRFFMLSTGESVKEPNVHVWRRAGAGDPGAGAGAGGEYTLEAAAAQIPVVPYVP